MEEQAAASRADDIAAEKDARFESIKAKLIAMGWEMGDFPMSDKAFRDLVLKDQKLTPKVWQNIKSKLELMLEKSHRRCTRQMAVSDFYHQMSREIMDLQFEKSEIGPSPRKFEAVLALPSNPATAGERHGDCHGGTVDRSGTGCPTYRC